MGIKAEIDSQEKAVKLEDTQKLEVVDDGKLSEEHLHHDDDEDDDDEQKFDAKPMVSDKLEDKLEQLVSEKLEILDVDQENLEDVDQENLEDVEPENLEDVEEDVKLELGNEEIDMPPHTKSTSLHQTSPSIFFHCSSSTRLPMS